MYAVSTWHYFVDPLAEALDGIAAAGFRLVEFWADSAHLDPRVRPDRRALAAQLSRLRLQAHSIHAPFSGLELGRPGGPSEDAIRTIADALTLGMELGARLAVVHVSSHAEDLADPARYAASKRVVRDFIQELDRVAMGLGVQLALENLPPHPHQRVWGRTLQELTAAFPEPRIGFCLDVGHAALNGASIPAEIETAGPRLRSLHVHNNDGVLDRHWPPTEGVISWPETKAALARIGYTGALVLEIDHGEDAHAVMRNLAAFAQRDVKL